MSVKVSIVMPVYNGEKYLKQAVDSILQQEEQEWELLMVDDGSTDTTASILDDYARLDSRIHVFHNQNYGVAYSRQFGVNHAQGEYCIHVDADDWVETDYLSSLLLRAEETDADMVWCDCFADEHSVWRMPCAENPDQMIRDILEQKHWGTIWNRLIKTEICQRREVRFPDCTMWEDMAYLVQNLLLCQKIVYLPRLLYHYRQNQSSLTHTQSQKDISAEYRKAIACIESALINNNRLTDFLCELRGLKLFAIRDFIDDKRFLDYNKFIATYPDAIEHISEYPNYPNRLKICAWLIQYHSSFAVPLICKIDAVLRRMGLSRQV